MFKKKRQLQAQNTEVSIKNIDGEDYFSSTDMLKAKKGDGIFVKTWLRNRNTIEFLGIWESIHNPSFNWCEFDLIYLDSGEQK